MSLIELLAVIESGQMVNVYKVGDDGFCYQGAASDVPDALDCLKVEAAHAYDWEIDILVTK